MSTCTSYANTHIYIADMRTKEVSKCTVTSERSIFKLKSRISMSFQPFADSFGICLLGFMCSWWHLRQANDAVAFERSIFSKNHNYKSLLYVAVNPLVPIFWDLHARGGRKLLTDTHTQTHTLTHTHTHTHTYGTTTVTLAVHACEG